MTPRTDSNRKMKKTCSNCVSRFLCPNNYRVCDGWNNEGLFWGLIKLNFPLPEEFIDEERAFIKLREMNGEPAWCRLKDEPVKGSWMLVGADRCENHTSIATYDDYEIEWLAYRRPPEGDADA